jgi:hypothetical protein
MQTFLERSGLQEVPVIPGASANPKRRFLPDKPLPSELPVWRSNAERLNQLLGSPVSRVEGVLDELAVRLRPHTEGCRSISLLVIGPWTSFLRYAPDILERVERIVVQGRPYPDELGGQPSGFNCTYDIDSCYAAFDLLIGRQERSGSKFRAIWVDIPGGGERCAAAEPGVDAHGKRIYAFSPVPSWAQELEHAADEAESNTLSSAGRVAREVAKLLQSNPGALEKTSLWDDLAALYMMQPELFAIRGGHVEPCVPSAAVRAALAQSMILQ